MSKINIYTPSKTNGAFVSGEFLHSLEFTSDEKIFLSYVRQYQGLNLNLEDLKQNLGFKNKRKIKNIISSLEEKTGGCFFAQLVDKDVYCFEEIEEKNVDKLIDSAKKIKEKTKEKNITYKNEIEKVVEYLNEKTNSNFKSSTAVTKRNLQSIFKSGYTVEDCQHVIDNQNRVWGKITHPMHKYLTPSTLFRMSNFEKYLNNWKHYNALSEEEKQQLSHKKLNRQQQQKNNYKNADLLG